LSERTQAKWIVAITGASGICYALRLIDLLSQAVAEVHVVLSDAGLRVLREEEQIKVSHSNLTSKQLLGVDRSNIYFYNPRDIGATIASGSALFEGMLIVPCTMGTLAAVSSGISANLIQRAADVTLKEGRRLIMVPRETPLSAIHLENMLKLSKLGVTIFPAMPGFYQNPQSINELVDLLVMKILDQMGVHTELVERWQPQKEQSQPLRIAVGPASKTAIFHLKKSRL